MYKVLLVDDEPYVIEGLKLMIPWESLGFEICGACGDGREAAALMESLVPDLVVTDIRMPFMDGLDLIAYTRKNFDKNIKFIILSGYGEFEHARKAMQYGVNHYVLKPVMDDEMTGILQEIAGQLKRQEELRDLQEMNGSEAIQDILSKIIQGEGMEVVAGSLTGFSEVFAGCSRWYDILVETGTACDSSAGAMVRRAAESLVRDRSFVYIVDHVPGAFSVIAGIDVPEDGGNHIYGFAFDLYRHIMEQCACNVFISVGEGVTDLASLRHSYGTARKAMDYKFYAGANSLVFYNEVKGEVLSNRFEDIACIGVILEAMENLDVPRVKEVIEEAFSDFRRKLLAPGIIKMLVINVIYRSINAIREMKGSPEELLKKYNLLDLEHGNFKLEELKELLHGYCEACIDYINSLRARESGGSIYAVEEYLRNNFRSNITIRDVAKSFYMNPVYLGQIFLKRFGMSLNEYLNKLRIEEAKRLIETTDMLTHEIAKEVGYRNYNNFFGKFEKHVGMVPTEYKKAFFTK